MYQFFYNFNSTNNCGGATIIEGGSETLSVSPLLAIPNVELVSPVKMRKNENQQDCNLFRGDNNISMGIKKKDMRYLTS